VSERSERALRKTSIRATIKLTYFLFHTFGSLPPPCSIKNAPRFAPCSFVGGLFLVSVAVALFLGSLLGWSSLAVQGDVPLDPTKFLIFVGNNPADEYVNEMKHIAGGFQFMFAGFAAIALFLHTKMVRKVA